MSVAKRHDRDGFSLLEVLLAMTILLGSLVVRDRSVAFVATGGPLPEGDYSVFLRSASDGFKHANGELLDGDNDSVPGGDFVDQFTIDTVASAVVSLCRCGVLPPAVCCGDRPRSQPL